MSKGVNWQHDLGRFIGTTKYWAWGPWRSRLTDGAKFLAEKAGCFWLFDEIEVMIQQHYQYNGLCYDNHWVFSTLTVNQEDSSATITLDNGNGKIIAGKSIEFTDFPLPKIEVWAQFYQPISGWVHMLPSEY